MRYEISKTDFIVATQNTLNICPFFKI